MRIFHSCSYAVCRLRQLVVEITSFSVRQFVMRIFGIICSYTVRNGDSQQIANL